MPHYAPGSFRDRDARVVVDDQGQIRRLLSPHAWTEWSKFETSPVCRSLIDCGSLIPTVVDDSSLDFDNSWSHVLQHERIPVVSYPFEWPFSMLKAAARLHLDLLLQLAPHGFSLKDGTAYNVQFRGIEPVFIDVTSIETLDASRPWVGYRQFCQTMLFPLMLQAYKGIAFHPWLRGRLDGINATEMSHLMSWRDLLRSGVWSHVKLHSWLESAAAQGGSSKSAPQPPFNQALLIANHERLRNLVDSLEWKAARSTWSEYENQHTYSVEDRKRKEEFVRKHLAQSRRKTVWDLGANTGTFSRIAADHSDQIVALDFDHLSIERLYRSLQSEPEAIRRKILPLVWNVADQAGGLGWQGKERVALPERSRPDLVLCLALIHHLVIQCGIPLEEFIAWLANLGSDLIIEFVDPTDSMAAGLLQRRLSDCPDYQWDNFHQELSRHFEVRDSLPLQGGQRTILMATRRP